MNEQAEESLTSNFKVIYRGHVFNINIFEF